MKKKIRYTNEDLGNLVIIKDFLPKPEDLVFREKRIKITLELTEKSVNFFKEQAEMHHTQYQKMIRSLLDEYVLHTQHQKKIQSKQHAHQTKRK